MHGGDDLLCEDHGDWVADESDGFGAEESGEVDHRRFGPDRVAYVDVEMEVKSCGGELCCGGDAHPGVVVVFTDDLRA